MSATELENIIAEVRELRSRFETPEVTTVHGEIFSLIERLATELRNHQHHYYGRVESSNTEWGRTTTPEQGASR